ncbi:tetratricopeptide repeat protein [Hyphobacterium sp. CCMP332]|nr:tetratricopeptide repeat protein [Hyphobacterium sp. CCMP332]
MQRNNFAYFFICFFCLILIFANGAEAQKRRKKKDKIDKIDKDFSEGDLDAEAEFYFVEAMRHLMLEDFDKAQKYFEKVLEIKPDLPAANYKIADLYLMQGKPRDALPYAKKALEFDNQNKAYYLLLARIYEFEQDFQKAANTLKELLSKVKGAEEHYFDLALIQTYLEDYSGALETYGKIQEVFGASAEVIQQKQRLLLKLNRLDEAIAEGEELIEAFPNEREYAYDLVKLLLSNDKKKEALQRLNAILDEDPDNPEALILMSDIYRSEEKLDSANLMLNKAFYNQSLDSESKMAIISNLMRFSYSEEEKNSLLRLTEILTESHPEDGRVQAFRADILLNYQEKDLALEAYKKAIKLDDSELLIWTNIVLLHFEMEEYDSVNHYASKALELFPNQGRLWFMDGLGYYSKNDFKSARNSLEMAEKYIVDKTAMRSDILSTLGDTYNSLEMFEESDAVYEEALSINPKNEHVLNNYSYYLSLREEDLDKAEEMCEKLMQMSPDNSTYLDTYAWVLYKLKKYDEALKYIEKAVIDSESGVVHEHYGDILFQLGRKDEALEAWKKAKEYEDASEEIDKKIRDRKLYE